MILVTGSTGLLGSHLLYALLQQYSRVAAMKRSSAKTDTLREIFSFYTKEPDLLMERIDWRTGDLLDRDSVVQALEGIHCVINCAAIVSFDKRDRERMIANNIQGTKNLGEAVMMVRSREEGSGGEEVRRWEDRKPVVIHISSTSALGDGPGDDPKFRIDENTPRDPKRSHTGYSVSKFESEKVLNEMGLDAIILNPGIILGSGQWSKGSSQLFVKAWQGLKYYPYGGTGYVDVRDLAAIILQIVDRVPGIGYRVSGIGYQVSGQWDQGSDLTSSPPHLLTSSPLLLPFFQGRYCVVGANVRYRDFFNKVTDEYGKPNPTVFAGKFMTQVAWRADTLRARLAGRSPLLTRETAETSQRINYYSSEKIRKALSFEFRPIEETIDWIATQYKNLIR